MDGIASKIIGAFAARPHLQHRTDIKGQETFVELGVDKLDLIETVMDIEEMFDISISDEDADKWKAVKDAIVYVAARLST